ncbi:MAG: ADP-ribose pyrophosphatase [Frankiales bacterium]|nr:ADP-ribose pyrophosphatase [Frankiales bacterium]
MARPIEPDVRAAGGVVWRVHRRRVEVALVHRSRNDDWSLPKGKLQEGETELAAAVREVREELGARVAVSRRIARIGYDVVTGRKHVTFWVMRDLGGDFEPGDEVDAVDWLRPRDARIRMTYPIERTVMSDFAAVPIPDSVIVLVRHAKAGKRSEWRGRDALRPLDDVGHAQAKRLVDFLAMFAPDRVISADPVRCVQTVQPLAEHLGLPLRVEPVFGDEAYAAGASTTETAPMSLAKPGKVTVVCSQGLTIPSLVDRLARGVHPSDTKKAGVWVLSIVDGSVVSADYYEDAVR